MVRKQSDSAVMRMVLYLTVLQPVTMLMLSLIHIYVLYDELLLAIEGYGFYALLC